jgi:hypothetical protein
MSGKIPFAVSKVLHLVFFFATVKVWITLSFSNLYRHDVDCTKRTGKSRENEG